MAGLRTFFYSYIKSLTSLEYYKDVVKAPLGFSLKVYLVWSVLVGVVVSGLIYFMVLAPLAPVLEVTPEIVTNYFPAELEITITEGRLRTNVDEPYMVPVSVVEDFGKELEQVWLDNVLGMSSDTPVNLVVIDTESGYEDFERYDTFVLVAETDLFVRDDMGAVRAYPLDEIEQGRINREVIASGLGRLAPIVEKLVPYLGVVVLVLMLVAYPAYKLAYLALFALLAWLVAKLLDHPLEFDKVYQIGMHQLMAVDTVMWLWLAASVPVKIPFMRVGLMLFMFVLVVRRLKERGKTRAKKQVKQA